MEAQSVCLKLFLKDTIIRALSTLIHDCVTSECLSLCEVKTFSFFQQSLVGSGQLGLMSWRGPVFLPGSCHLISVKMLLSLTWGRGCVVITHNFVLLMWWGPSFYVLAYQVNPVLHEEPRLLLYSQNILSVPHNKSTHHAKWLVSEQCNVEMSLW